ncbi:primase-helicase family protein [Ruegeria arenilitoris]|uniref:primase-helicase family protein n=1 Tax=Ruegeria arenilitoris TaxID=1173585 RepID=UPI00147B8B01|nr:primase-helicase family protein [Ruegeria arenilitoris]
MAPKDIKKQMDAHEYLKDQFAGDHNGPDALVVLRRLGDKPANKIFDADDNGDVTKQAAGNAASYQGLQIPVPDQEAMVTVLEAVGNDPQACLILGRFVDAPAHPFLVLSSKAMEDFGGTDDGWCEKNEALAICRKKNNMRPTSWLLIDRDFTDEQPDELTFHDTDEWWQAMCRIAPGLETAGRIDLPSSSSRIINADGKPLFTSPSSHHYVQLKDPNDLGRLGPAMLAQAMLMGLGFRRRWGDYGRCWSIYDPTTFSWERLSFEGAPVTYAEDTAIVPPQITVGAKGGRFDSSTVETPEDEARTKLAQEHKLTISTRNGYSGVPRVHVLEDHEALGLDTEIAVQIDGREQALKLQDIWLYLSGTNPEAKLRAQAPFRPSESWAAFVRLGPSDGVPFVYDVGPHVKFCLRERDQAGPPVDDFLDRLEEAEGEEAVRWVQASARAIGRHKTTGALTDIAELRLLEASEGVLAGTKADRRKRIEKWIKATASRDPETGVEWPWMDEALTRMNERYGVVMAGGKTVVLEEVKNELGDWTTAMRIPREIEQYMANKMAKVPDGQGGYSLENVFKTWMCWQHRNTFDRVVFEPSVSFRPQAPRKIQQGGNYNLWMGYTVEPVSGGSAALKTVLDHVYSVWCSSEEEKFEFVMDWMAAVFQHPDRVNLPALVLKSTEGVGKGIIVDGLLMKILGIHGFVVSKSEDFTGRFNAHMSTSVLVSLNEAVWGGKKDVAGQYKALLTDEYRKLEYKFLDAMQVRNYTKAILSTNEDWFAPLGLQDRRHAVLECNDCRTGDTEYFRALRKAVEDCRGHFLHEMLTREIDFDTLRNPPKWESSAAEEATFLTANSVAAWLYDFLSTGESMTDKHATYGCHEPDDKTLGVYVDKDLDRIVLRIDEDGPVYIPKTLVIAAYERWCRRHRRYEYPVGEAQFGRRMNELLGDAVETNKKKRIGERTGSGQKREEVRVTKFARLSNLRTAFGKSIEQPIKWVDT